jgi:hypothetical protein
VAHDAAVARLLEQTWQLHRIARQRAVTVDQRIAQHRGAHALAGRVQYQLVDGDARGLVGGRRRQLVFVVDLVGAFAARGVADDAGAAGVQEYLAGTGEGVDKGFTAARLSLLAALMTASAARACAISRSRSVSVPSTPVTPIFSLLPVVPACAPGQPLHGQP